MSDDGPTVYNIPAGVSFVDALAAGIAAQAADDPLALARFTILLPTRRASRTLQEAFLRQGAGKALLLPRMLPLGDLDEDELAIAGAEEDLGPVADLPPAISGLRRQILLARLVMAFEPDHASPDQAAQLAAELARLLDQVQTERLPFDGLANLVSEKYAEHWQITLDFLKIVTEQWPAILAEENCLDPSQRRNHLLEAQAELWQRNPPDHPIVAAGSTGSIPATADLLAAIAQLPLGCVVLPGLDVEMSDAVRAQLEPTHPQFGMNQLLDRLGLSPEQVQPWPAAEGAASYLPRAALIAEALRPASTTDRWRELGPIEPVACEGITLASFPGQDEEARGIALTMRQAAETEGRTAALVTPDRRLARRVAAELGRWGIAVDDSAGQPLAQTPPGNFLRLTAEMVASGCSPIALLAACKHPLAAGGMRPATFRRLTRRLEEKVLRGPRPAPGVAGLLAAMPAKEKETLEPFLDQLAACIDPFDAALADPHCPFSELARAHIQMAEAFAATDAQSGAERLWSGDAGEAASGYMVELMESSAPLDQVPGVNYAVLLDIFMQGRAVRPRYGRHARLFIWGLMEARLQRADLMILGGLNEGSWPPDVQADPWMSRPMRAEFGLPLPERRIGLAAHDFVQAFSAPEIILSRAERIDGAPTVPSRWLVRLEKLLQGTSADGPFLPSGDWRAWQAALDAPDKLIQTGPPAPRPPVAARPRRLSVTQIETWMRDPYAIYARHILGLRALDPIDAAPDAADYGTRVHDAIDKFIEAFPVAFPDDAAFQLDKIGREVFASALHHPAVWAFWWPRFERIAGWFVGYERNQRAAIKRSVSEVHGELVLPFPAGDFRLTAIADRVDQLQDGSLRLIDYKTGAVPSAKEVAAGFAPQLPLEAVIAAAGGFDGVGVARVASLDYWRLRGSDPAGEVRSLGDDVGAMARAAEEGLRALISSFDRPETPYEARPRPDAAPRYSDYEHLARVKEWASLDGEDGP